jgi:hypothetical protein
MTAANVNCNPANPCARFQSPGNMLGKLHSGSVYNRRLYDKLITNPTRQLLAPIVLYFDKSHVTNGSNCFALEPGSFTTSLFTEVKHRPTDAWGMLGFIHQLLKSSAENAALHLDMNVNNSHRQLNVILRGIAEVQHGIDQRLTNVTLTIDDHTFECQLLCPIICVITDTPAANIVCGRFNSASSKIARPHRTCDCTHDQLDNADCVCVFVHAKELFKFMTTGTPAELK